MSHDVLIIGGGPAGLSAALVLGRGRKRVLLCDAGPPRNARAVQIHTFVTRDGTPPHEFRRVAHEQLQAYPNVERRDVRVAAIAPDGDWFVATLDDGTRATARRVVLAVGMRDVLPDLPGLPELWGHSAFQCPYCHGWEVQERAFAYLSPGPEWFHFGVFLGGWSRDVVVLTGGAYAVDDAARDELRRAGVGLDERPLRRLVARDGELAAIEFVDGGTLAREVLFMRPPQQQTELVTRLGVELDAQGYVRVDAHGQTSIPGVFAAGDLTTPAQAALIAASAGMMAAITLNHALTMAQALSGDPAASRAPGEPGR